MKTGILNGAMAVTNSPDGLDLPGVDERAVIAIACAWECAFAGSAGGRQR